MEYISKMTGCLGLNQSVITFMYKKADELSHKLRHKSAVLLWLCDMVFVSPAQGHQGDFSIHITFGSQIAEKKFYIIYKLCNFGSLLSFKNYVNNNQLVY